MEKDHGFAWDVGCQMWGKSNSCLQRTDLHGGGAGGGTKVLHRLSRWAMVVPDARLEKLAAIAGSKADYSDADDLWSISRVWCAGASKGEAGQPVLANNRECDAIFALRCFEDDDINKPMCQRARFDLGGRRDD
jgi:hypothetical protein